MGYAANDAVGTDSESSSSPLLSDDKNGQLNSKIPKDSFNLAYIIYFTMAVGYGLPWNAFITAVDYFSYIYPEASVERVFSVVYMVVATFFLTVIIAYAHRSNSHVSTNVGLGLFIVALLVVPVMDMVYIRGRIGIYNGFYVTAATVALAGLANALVQGGVYGSAGKLPERYMQAVVAGTSVSGVVVSFLRIFTKASYAQDSHGLRKSANLYFAVSITMMIICIVCHNVAHRLPVINYHNNLKQQAAKNEKAKKGELSGHLWRSTLWNVFASVKWYGFGFLVTYAITLSIFPGYITENVRSERLEDWYPVLLITDYNVFDLLGKILPVFVFAKNKKVLVGLTLIRLLFVPICLGFLQSPEYFGTEVPVGLLTCLVGVSSGYLSSVFLTLAPRAVELQHSETAAIVVSLFALLGLAVGSVLSWCWNM